MPLARASSTIAAFISLIRSTNVFIRIVYATTNVSANNRANAHTNIVVLCARSLSASLCIMAFSCAKNDMQAVLFFEQVLQWSSGSTVRISSFSLMPVPRPSCPPARSAAHEQSPRSAHRRRLHQSNSRFLTGDQPHTASSPSTLHV